MSTHLLSGKIVSCGCYLRSVITKHGRVDSPEYGAWKDAKRRCYDPSSNAFHNYGGRGIQMAPEWKNDFGAFFAHIGLRPSQHHTLERINNNGNYEPGNVRWATRKQQANNRRNNRIVNYEGKSYTFAQLASHLGVDWKTVKRRYGNVR